MLYTETYKIPINVKRVEIISAFLALAGLDFDENIDAAVCLFDDEMLVACGCISKNILKCIATHDDYRGEGLLGGLMTELMRIAFEGGHTHLFIFTKPKNSAIFAPFGFYEISKTEHMLLMENVRGGIASFVKTLQRGHGVQGAVVANCNPFTLGHKYLIEQASARCDSLHVFVLSEEKGDFAAGDRFELVRRGTAHIKNVILHPTSYYIVSGATFPTYFLKESVKTGGEATLLDLTVFCDYFVPALDISCRFVGTEPYCGVTSSYNECMKGYLPTRGVEVLELERLEIDGAPISASRVRRLIQEGKIEQLRQLVPQSTYDFIIGCKISGKQPPKL